MHRYPTVQTHLDAIRQCLLDVPDVSMREEGLELVERVEIYIRFKKLTKSMMREALSEFRHIPGATASVQALEALAGARDA